MLDDVRRIAAAEGRQFQAVLDEALAEWVEKKKGEAPRPDELDWRAIDSWVRRYVNPS